MRRLLLVFIKAVCMTGPAFAQLDEVPIIPAPNAMQVADGKFLLTAETVIEYGNPGDQPTAQLFQEFLLHHYKLKLLVQKMGSAAQRPIRFTSANYKGPNKEGYELVISPGTIIVSGKGAGLFYGLQTLLQLFPLHGHAAIDLPCLKITDEPRFKYRGIMQDVGYHLFPVAFIKQEIDLLAKYKMNVYHWHLTEDHGWRVAIDKYPKLTSVGAYRAQTVISNYNGDMTGMDGTPYGGYYSKDEVREIVSYAAKRHITVIPEIELPGHSLAALAAYPHLACGDNPGPFKVAEVWGIYDDVYCAGKETTFKFLEDMLQEVMDLFPSEYIHIGGDECPKKRWAACTYCQQRMQDNKLKDEKGLQSYFIKRIEKFVNSKGRKIIGWDEILEGGLAPNATVMSWRGIEEGKKAALQNHDVVMSPQSYVYFDFIQGAKEQEPLAIEMGYNPIERVYGFDPVPAGLNKDQQQHIIGVEAPLWTEHMETPGNVTYMLLPRLFALAEVAWTLPERKNYKAFYEKRLPQHLARLDTGKTIYRVPNPIGIKDTLLWGAHFDLALTAPVPGAAIYFNWEGQLPRETDYRYDTPIKIIVPEGEKRALKTIVITPSGKRSTVTTTHFVNRPPQPPVDAHPGNTHLRNYFEKGVYTGYIEIVENAVYTFAVPVEATIEIDDHEGERNSDKYNHYDIYVPDYRQRQRTYSFNLQKGFHKLEIDGTKTDDGFKIEVSVAGKPFTEMGEQILYKN